MYLDSFPVLNFLWVDFIDYLLLWDDIYMGMENINESRINLKPRDRSSVENYLINLFSSVKGIKEGYTGYEGYGTIYYDTETMLAYFKYIQDDGTFVFRGDIWAEIQDVSDSEIGYGGNDEINQLIFNLVHEFYGVTVTTILLNNNTATWNRFVKTGEINESRINLRPIIKKFPDKIYGDYPDGEWERTEYDENGNIIYWVDSKGHWYKYGYDDYGQLVDYQDHKGKWSKWIYDDDGNVIDYKYQNEEINESRINLRKKDDVLRDYLNSLFSRVSGRVDNTKYDTLFYDPSDMMAYFRYKRYTGISDTSFCFRNAEWEEIMKICGFELGESNEHTKDIIRSLIYQYYGIKPDEYGTLYIVYTDKSTWHWDKVVSEYLNPKGEEEISESRINLKELPSINAWVRDIIMNSKYVSTELNDYYLMNGGGFNAFRLDKIKRIFWVYSSIWKQLQKHYNDDEIKKLVGDYVTKYLGLDLSGVEIRNTGEKESLDYSALGQDLDEGRINMKPKTPLSGGDPWFNNYMTTLLDGSVEYRNEQYPEDLYVFNLDSNKVVFEYNSADDALYFNDMIFGELIDHENPVTLTEPSVADLLRNYIKMYYNLETINFYLANRVRRVDWWRTVVVPFLSGGHLNESKINLPKQENKIDNFLNTYFDRIIGFTTDEYKYSIFYINTDTNKVVFEWDKSSSIFTFTIGLLFILDKIDNSKTWWDMELILKNYIKRYLGVSSGFATHTVLEKDMMPRWKNVANLYKNR